eukprot:TRINITY_DN7856_c1_g1_i8.p2 TRINITY_DN7856_c1_g1~~TRINITY_DN7856_c1_g1_i8.p2  ORF type:complete len:205 (-),score=16.87 TRINITY_DN7856_c1_g1_i8:183-797(-)
MRCLRRAFGTSRRCSTGICPQTSTAWPARLPRSFMLCWKLFTLRMPIVEDLTYHRNFITKIIKYHKVIDIPNSMTVLPELIPYSIEMSKRKLTGIMNYTNPGAISHNEILQLYKEYIDPDFTWSNFTIEEQAAVIVAPRSNNLLDTERFKSEFPELLGIKESLIKYVFEPNAKKKDEVKKAVDEMRAEYRKAQPATDVLINWTR